MSPNSEFQYPHRAIDNAEMGESRLSCRGAHPATGQIRSLRHGDCARLTPLRGNRRFHRGDRQCDLYVFVHRPRDCKHVVAVPLDVIENPPVDESERIETVIGDVSFDDLRSFVIDELARNPRCASNFSGGSAYARKVGRRVPSYCRAPP